MQVYIIGSKTGPNKIGVSGHLRQRIVSIQQTYPFEAKLMGYVEIPDRQDAFALEKALHKLFLKTRVEGEQEWFNSSADEIKSTMESLGLTVDDSGRPPWAPSKYNSVPKYIPYEMIAGVFEAWHLHMRRQGYSQRSMALMLGTTSVQIARWCANGAPPYIGLACEAIEHRLHTWTTKSIKRGRPKILDNLPLFDETSPVKYIVRQSSDRYWWVCRSVAGGSFTRLNRFVTGQEACDALEQLTTKENHNDQ